MRTQPQPWPVSRDRLLLERLARAVSQPRVAAPGRAVDPALPVNRLPVVEVAAAVAMAEAAMAEEMGMVMAMDTVTAVDKAVALVAVVVETAVVEVMDRASATAIPAMETATSAEGTNRTEEDNLRKRSQDWVID